MQFEPWAVPSYENIDFPAFEDFIVFENDTFEYRRGFKNYLQDADGNPR